MAAFAASLVARALRAGAGPLLAALPGGSTPLPFFRELSRRQLPWEKAVFFMSDERTVPLSSPHSNFGAARRLFFSRAGVPAASLRPVRGADSYDRLLRREGPLDLVFLGLGGDGHTASLFPGSPALRSARLASAVKAPAGVTPRRRVTLTLKAINAAGTVVLMAAGPGKKEVFLRAAASDRALPAGRLKPRGELYLLFSEKA